MGRTVRVAVLAVVLVAALPLAGLPAAGAVVQAGTSALADFNGDGIDDLVVGVPLEDLGGAANAGVVDVIYGSESGLADGGRQQLTQALPEAGDAFGSAVATGDFNGDIFTDLAVGVPGENVGAIADAGAVEVFYGGGGGLPSVGDQLLRQGAGGLAGTAEGGDRFGAALATGLVDDGDEAELAIGAPNEDVGATADAGAVSLVDGAAGGLLGSDNVLITENQPETGDRFGQAVEIGDLTQGGLPTDPHDLAVGAPAENVGSAVDAGAVSLLESAADGSGLAADAPQERFYQGFNGVPGASESGDLFGFSLAAGLFGAGGHELVIGTPGEDLGTATDAGAAVYLLTSSHALLAQGVSGPIASAPGVSEAGDRFGWSLGAADFDDNNADNLVIGVPGEDVGGDTDAGISLCGFDGFLSGCAAGTLLQGNPEDGDGYGQSLTPGNFDGNEVFDLAVGAPLETVNGRAGAGAVDARDGSSPSGLPADPDEPLYFQGNDGVPGTAEAGDLFAAALAA
jgi:FG-GAP repeat